MSIPLADALRDPLYASLGHLQASVAISKPIKTPKTASVTLKSLGGTWGLTRAVEFRAFLAAAATQQNSLGAFAATVLDLLCGTGFDPAHPDVASAVATLAAVGACTGEEADEVLYDTGYLCGAPVTQQQVQAARLLNDRQDAAAAYRDAIQTYLNEVLNPAESNPSLPLVSPQDYFAGEGEQPVAMVP